MWQFDVLLLQLCVSLICCCCSYVFPKCRPVGRRCDGFPPADWSVSIPGTHTPVWAPHSSHLIHVGLILKVHCTFTALYMCICVCVCVYTYEAVYMYVCVNRCVGQGKAAPNTIEFVMQMQIWENIKSCE